MHLTFSYGDPLPGEGLFRAISHARHDLRDLIDQGAIQPIEEDGEIRVWEATPSEAMIEPGDVILAVRSAKILDSEIQAWHLIRYADVLKAIALLEWCSLARKPIRGIWAYVYLRGVHVGYIWTEKYVPPVTHLQLAGATG